MSERRYPTRQSARRPPPADQQAPVRRNPSGRTRHSASIPHPSPRYQGQSGRPAPPIYIRHPIPVGVPGHIIQGRFVPIGQAPGPDQGQLQPLPHLPQVAGRPGGAPGRPPVRQSPAVPGRPAPGQLAGHVPPGQTPSGQYAIRAVPNPRFVRVPKAANPRDINLDEMFGNPQLNVTGEPVTPTKVAIFYLIRTLFHAHFGIGAVPSLRPFRKHEKTKAFSMIYGLILHKYEVRYNDFRRLVRILNEELGRAIYYHFVISMEKLALGEESIDLLFENAFYTGKRPQHPEVLQRRDEKLDELTFMSKQSFIYTWIKRVMIQYTRTSQKGLFEIGVQMRHWLIMGYEIEGRPPLSGINAPLPLEIDCSVRAREWIDHQLRLVQLCPSKAMSFSKIFKWCGFIEQRHHDVFSVHLLKAAIHVQMKNAPDAIKSLNTFFDLSMLEITENSIMALNTLKILEPCQVALRYGPILQGRVHRLLGDKESANVLFGESIQQSQMHVDEMCNRLANMELTINSVITPSAVLERPISEQPIGSDEERKDKRAKQFTHHAAADLNNPSLRALQKSFHEDYELHTYLVSMSKLMLCIEDMSIGKYTRRFGTPKYVFLALHRLRQIYDPHNKSRAIEDYANAIMTSGLIQSGMYNQAKRVASTMMTYNFRAVCCPKMETESHAVAGVNLVYSLAAEGDYDRAFQTISSLQSVFPANINWQSARHVSLCSQLIRFERDLLHNKYTLCHEHLIGLESTAPLEFVLRKSLLHAATGKMKEAVTLLKSYKCGDIRGNMRIHMQLATIHTAFGYFEDAEYQLAEAGKLSTTVHFRDANFLVTRRVATWMLARGRAWEASQILTVLSSKAEDFCSFIEKAIYYISSARCARMLNQDPRMYLKKCKSLVINNRWPAMEKLVLTELTLLHQPGGMYPDETRASWAKERFGRIEADFPGPCSWMLI